MSPRPNYSTAEQPPPPPPPGAPRSWEIEKRNLLSIIMRQNDRLTALGRTPEEVTPTAKPGPGKPGLGRHGPLRGGLIGGGAGPALPPRPVWWTLLVAAALGVLVAYGAGAVLGILVSHGRTLW